MLKNKKIFITLVIVLVCCIFALLPGVFNNEKTKSNIETDTPKEIITEETMKKMREERKVEIRNWNNALSIATDIYHSVIEDELNLDSVMFNNNGLKTIDTLTYYSITLTDEDDNLLKEIGINFENNNYVYISNNKTEPIPNYQYIGNFVKALQPWYLEENKISLEENQYERYGTMLYLYKEKNKLIANISTYNSFSQIAQIEVEPELTDDNTLSFSFEDDGYGNSGTGTISFVNDNELKLDIKRNNISTSFGIFNGTGKLFQAKK